MRTRHPRGAGAPRRLTPLLLLAAIAAGACGDNGVEPATATSLTAVGTATFTGTVGDVLNQPLVVRVNDQRGAPLPGVAVSFAVNAGEGSVAPATVSTNADGEARTTWTLGPRPGEQRVTATVSGVSTGATFVATAAVGAPSQVTIVAGNTQSAPAGSALPVNPAVRVRDRFGNNVAGASVFFAVTAGGGQLAATGATSNAEGIATAGTWTLGSAAGVNRLSALVVASGVTGNPVEFTATGTAGAASRIVALTDTRLSGAVNTLVEPRPSVRVTDAAGNPVSGVQVTFTGATGSTVTGAVTTTDATGIATVESWRLGQAARDYTLSVAAAGITSPVVFTATARAGAAAAVAAFAGTGQSATVGRPVPVEPAVRVLDAFGNPLAGVEVLFEVTGGGGFAVGRNAVTNANGVATVGGWTLGDTPGINSLRATVSGSSISGNPVLFQATATPGQPASLSVQAGNGQSAAVNTAVTIAPSVIVRDARGNAVPNVSVQFSIGSGSGSLTGASATTNSAGIAAVGSWTLGPLAGAQTLIARVTGLADVVFTATATPGVPAAVELLTANDLGTLVVNSLVATLPSVRVRDASGNPLAGVQVTFQLDPATGSGQLTGAVQTTGLNGIATLGSWRVGTVAGTVAGVRIFVDGLDLAGAEPTVVAALAAGPATQMTVAAGSSETQAAAENAAVGTLPAVLVRDQFGNPVANATVVFTVSTGSGTVTGATALTSASGVATLGSWTMPAGSGTRTLTATVAGTTIPGIVFTATVP